MTYRATAITKGFSGVKVLGGIDFAVRPGSIHGLLGHNGAGKSTLLKILSGAQPQDGGELALDDKVVRFASPRDALDQGVACVYRELRLVPNLTVAENVFLGRELRRGGFRDLAAMNAHTAEILAEHGLRAAPTDKIGTLSHPDKQMIEVIANLDSRARFLFLDEPTTALDGNQAREMLEAVRKIAEERNIGVVLVSHKLDEVLAICDEITVLAGGKVVLHDAAARLDKGQIIAAIAGAHHEPAPRAPRTTRDFPDKVLKVVGLKGPRLADVSLQVGRGEIQGIFGLVGSGRTRFLRTLYGMEPTTGGRIELMGHPYAPKSPHQAIAARVAYLTEERKRDGFVPLMSAYQNTTLPVLGHFRTALGLVDHAAAAAQAARTLSSISTRGVLGNPVKSLSGGNQQKVLLGRIIEQDAGLILLDEPTKGVDIAAKADIYAIIRHLAAEGRAVVVVSSEEEELLELADRITFFRHGRCDGQAFPAADLTIADLRREAWSA